MTCVQWNRSIPVRYEADVAVIGGGIAGVSAACAAAISGAEVILVERFAVTGGNATTGGVAAFCGETAGQGEVFDTIVSDLEEWNAIAPYRPYSDQQRGARVFDHHILAVILQELLIRRGAKLFLHTRFVDVCYESGRISACIVYGKSGLEALRAKIFIDCTGEAEVAHAMGFATMKGKPEDGCQLPMSMMGFVREVENVEPQVPEGWFERIRDKDDLPMVSIWPIAAGRCFSADQLALSSARVMTTGSMLGQAAGIAAAMCAESNCMPMELDFQSLRNTVESRGAKLEI